MDLSEMLSLSLKVIADWRVVFITLAVLLGIAILRYVGLVYHKAPKTRARPSSPGSGAAMAGGGKARRGKSAAESTSGSSDLIE
jgi:hypothetical protein